MRVPNQKAVKEIYRDDDGWWVQLKPGYIWKDMGSTVVNGENFKQLCEAMKDVVKKENKR